MSARNDTSHGSRPPKKGGGRITECMLKAVHCCNCGNDWVERGKGRLKGRMCSNCHSVNANDFRNVKVRGYRCNHCKVTWRPRGNPYDLARVRCYRCGARPRAIQ